MELQFVHVLLQLHLLAEKPLQRKRESSRLPASDALFLLHSLRLRCLEMFTSIVSLAQIPGVFDQGSDTFVGQMNTYCSWGAMFRMSSIFMHDAAGFGGFLSQAGGDAGEGGNELRAWESKE